VLRALLWLLVFLTVLMAAELRPAPGERIYPGLSTADLQRLRLEPDLLRKAHPEAEGQHLPEPRFPLNASKPGVEMCMRMAPRWSQQLR
jgi:hypothetical protein